MKALDAENRQIYRAWLNNGGTSANTTITISTTNSPLLDLHWTFHLLQINFQDHIQCHLYLGKTVVYSFLLTKIIYYRQYIFNPKIDIQIIKIDGIQMIGNSWLGNSSSWFGNATSYATCSASSQESDHHFHLCAKDRYFNKEQ